MSPSPITPKALEPGSTIGIISPSARLNHIYPSVVSRGLALLTSRGYKVRELYTRDTSIQSGIQNRLAEIRTAFTDPSIDAVVCTIGGPTFTELLPALVADTALHAAIRENPKIFVGYSDITGFHWFLHAFTGLRTFYGPCIIPELGQAVIPTADLPGGDADNSPVKFCEDNLFRVITPLGRSVVPAFPRAMHYAPRGDAFWSKGDSHAHVPPALAPNTFGWEWIRGGRAEGRLFGGCLTVVARVGAVRAIVPDWKGRIVFLETAMGDDEDGGNPLPRVQAAIADLVAQGVFDEAAGLVVGRPYGYDSAEQRGEYKRVIRELLCEGRLVDVLGRDFPILFGVDFGHTTPMVTLPYDVMAVLDSERDLFGLLEPTVL
ncbi:peptidase family S66 [Microdochium trichocladiopsis]|uniref:Peptidase family S66 n=1 Tax=Microdochium trichocladiopsis TaxID=1682393 RepID=A0A9P9BJA8_9PEZI|nr:peptidase family S66 [Microdochium trichocladiopsis]KAH7014446.1 peptidase family S66 [Microdochium trichocladiopsis]